MILGLKRFYFQEKCTVGKWSIDGEPLNLFSLEDKVREIDGKPVSEWKIPCETAIPRGRYKAIITYSEHFGRMLPELQNVPGYTGVRIHPGNTDLQTEGCLLPGKTWTGGDFIGESRAAFEILFEKIRAAIAGGEDVFVDVA